MEEALDIEVKHFGSANVEVAKTKHNLGVLLRRMGKNELAARHYAEAVKVLEVTLPGSHPKIGVAKHDYAILLRIMGRLEESMQFYSEAADVYRGNLPQYAEELSRALNGLGKLHGRLGRLEESIDAFAECLSIREEILPEGHWRLGTAHSLLGQALSRTQDANAEMHLRVGLAILRADLGDEDEKTLEAEERLERFLSGS